MPNTILPRFIPLRLPKGAPIPFKPEVTEKEHVFFVNVPARPRMVLTDPQQTVLCDLNEDKGRDLWSEQLKAAPSVASRLRAVAYFGKTKLPADRDLLAKSLFEEKFFGVQIAIASRASDSKRSSTDQAALPKKRWYRLWWPRWTAPEDWIISVTWRWQCERHQSVAIERKVAKVGVVKTDWNRCRSEWKVEVSCMCGLLVARVPEC